MSPCRGQTGSPADNIKARFINFVGGDQHSVSRNSILDPDNSFLHFNGVDGETRTLTAFATAPSRRRVYQFHHVDITFSKPEDQVLCTVFTGLQRLFGYTYFGTLPVCDPLPGTVGTTGTGTADAGSCAGGAGICDGNDCDGVCSTGCVMTPRLSVFLPDTTV